jgi:proteasome lid subunit RPN8/RPN11
MSTIDVRDLADETLPDSSFPASSRADFRVYFAPEVHRGTWDHAKHDVSFEICGVLVGRWEKDENGPYVVVVDYIRCDTATSKTAEVTFTHESWSQINREMDSKFSDARIVGWYHSHPDFGIFLSDRDCFIHEHFFENPGQIAYVIDPIRETEGVFAWREGKPTPLPHYWIGNAIQTEGSEGSPTRRGGAVAPLAAPPAPSERHWLSDVAMIALTGLVMFMLGNFLAQQKQGWERQMIEQGAVAHYGLNKFMKIGLEKDLAAVEQHLGLISKSMEELPKLGDELTDDQREAAEKLRGDILSNLEGCRNAIGDIERHYGLSEGERQVLMQLVVQKQLELRKQLESPKEASAAPTAEKKEPTASPEKEPSVPEKVAAPLAPPADVETPSTTSNETAE